MFAVIMAGGEGTRLRPLTENRPKPLLPIIGRPCIDFVLSSLTEAGFKEIVITAGYRADQIIDVVGDGTRYDGTILHSIEDQPLGTAGSVKKVEKFLNDTFIVASADVLADVDIKKVYQFHKKRKAIATIALTKVENPCEFGIVGIDKRGRIKRFLEKPRPEEIFSNLINAGIYVLEPEVLDFVPSKGSFDFSKNLYPKLLKLKKPLYGKPIEGLWMDIGRPSDLIGANIAMVKKTGKRAKIGRKRTTAPVIIEEGTIIDKTVKVKGPCYIGRGVRIRSKSLIENSAIYENTVVDSGAKVLDSLVMSGSEVGPGGILEGSLLGERCVLGPNKKLKDQVLGDHEEIV